MGESRELVPAEQAGGIVIPLSGELVDPRDHAQCVRALAHVRDLEHQLRETKQALTEALIDGSMLIGSKTITLPDGTRAEVKGGTETEYDAEAIEAEFRQAGMPEARIRTIIEEIVTYRVKAVEAKRAAAANPEYAQIVERHRRTVERPSYVSIHRKGRSS
jgi:hypothetical protein